MKKYIISALALLFSFNVKAIEFRPYVSGKVNFYDTKHDTTDDFKFKDNQVIGGSIALGISNSNNLPLRIEFEFSSINDMSDESSIDLGIIGFVSRIKSYFLNFYYDFYNKSNFVPYINFGIGLSEINTTFEFYPDYFKIKEKDRALSWQIGFGSYYKITNKLFADIGFKYNQTYFNDNLNLISDLFLVSLGLRYSF